MCRSLVRIAALAAALGPLTAGAAERVDVHGDPLPAHALARMGSVRLRHYGASDLIAMPDGKTLVSASGRELRFWEVASGRLLRTIALGEPQYAGSAVSLARSGDGKAIVTAHSDGTIRLWNAEFGRQTWVWQSQRNDVAMQRFGVSNVPRSAALSADGKVLVTAAAGENAMNVLDAVTGRETGQLRQMEGVVLACALSDDGRVAAALVASPNRQRESLTRVVVWDVESKAIRKSAERVEGQFHALALSADGRRLALAEDDAVTVREIDGGREVWRARTALKANGGRWVARKLTFAADGASVFGFGSGDDGNPNAAGQAPSAYAVWDAANGAEKAQWVADDFARTACFVPGSTTLASLGRAAIRLWDASGGRELLPELSHPQNCGAVVVSADGKVAVSCGTGEKSLRTWDVATGREIRRFVGGLAYGSDEVGISYDGRFVAASERIGVVRVWNAATGELVQSLNENGRSALLRFTPDGLGTAAYDGQEPTGVRLWDAGAGRVLREPQTTAPFSLAGLLASADGRMYGVEIKKNDGSNPRRSEDHYTFRVWDAAEERAPRVFRGHTGNLLTAVVSGDGRTLATRSGDNTIRLWEMATGGERRRIDHASHYLQCTQNLAISADGRTVASVDRVGRNVVVWDAVTGQQLAEFAGHSEQLIAMEFTPDGKRLVSGAYDGTLLVWDVAAVRRAADRPHRKFGDAALGRYWDDLQSGDAAQAYRAIWDLQDAPDQAARLLRESLERPDTPPDPERVEKLIRDLDSNRFAVRDAADRELRSVIVHAEAALRAELAKTTSAEVRHRVTRLLEVAGGVSATPKQLREQRAVEVLESLRTPAAKQLLADLSRDHGDNFLGREARLALKRWSLTLQ